MDRQINKQRLIVVGVVHNQQDDILLCKMPPKRGVFPDQWGLPGGGIEAGETIEVALRRELREEIGIEVTQIQPLFFTDGLYTKLFPDGDRQEIYMVFLIFACLAGGEQITLNSEFEAYA
jgi:nucleoside triphosphatase